MLWTHSSVCTDFILVVSDALGVGAASFGSGILWEREFFGSGDGVLERERERGWDFRAGAGAGAGF